MLTEKESRMKSRTRIASTLMVVLMAVQGLAAAAKEIPAKLPDPDGKAPDTTKSRSRSTSWRVSPTWWAWALSAAPDPATAAST